MARVTVKLPGALPPRIDASSIAAVAAGVGLLEERETYSSAVKSAVGVGG